MKIVRNVVLAAVAASLLAACGSTVSGKKENDTGTWWKNNLRGYWYVWKRDATDMYRTFDRHFFNYDWDDPYIN